MLTGFVAALIACLSYGTSSVLQAYGARRSAAGAQARGVGGQRTTTGAPTMASTVAAALTMWFLLGSVLDVLGFVGATVSARLIPLFLAQTIMSANLIVTAVFGANVLGIRLHRRDAVAITTVILALVALALAAGHRGVPPPALACTGAFCWRRCWSCYLVTSGSGGWVQVVRCPRGSSPGCCSVRWPSPCASSVASPQCGGRRCWWTLQHGPS